MKKLLSIAAVAALVLTGCNKDLKVTPAEKLTIEYGDKLDNNKLFDAKKSDKNIKVDKVQDFKESWKSDLEGHIYGWGQDYPERCEDHS
jgi:hypothetical protein